MMRKNAKSRPSLSTLKVIKQPLELKKNSIGHKFKEEYNKHHSPGDNSP